MKDEKMGDVYKTPTSGEQIAVKIWALARSAADPNDVYKELHFDNLVECLNRLLVVQNEQ